jgi:hypothetical protein
LAEDPIDDKKQQQAKQLMVSKANIEAKNEKKQQTPPNEKALKVTNQKQTHKKL